MLEHFRAASATAPSLAERAVAAVAQALPKVPPPDAYGSLADVVKARAEGRPWSEATVADAIGEVAGVAAAAVLDLGLRLDAVDRSAERTLEGQAADAALKLLGLAAMAARLATPAEDGLDALRRLPAGRQALAWWAAVEVVLPLGDTDVERLLQSHRDAQSARLVSLVGEDALHGVGGLLSGLVGTTSKLVGFAARRPAELASALAPFVPGLVAPGDGADERVAAGADRLPVWSWLAARLAAEWAADRALAAGAR